MEGASYDYDQYCVYTDPLFCGPVDCGQTTEGDWWLNSDSPCIPEHSPCGHLIGALGLGCGPSAPLGACCLADGSCVYVTAEECRGQNGSYQGDHVPCTQGLCQPTPVESSTWGRIKARFRQ